MASPALTTSTAAPPPPPLPPPPPPPAESAPQSKLLKLSAVAAEISAREEAALLQQRSSPHGNSAANNAGLGIFSTPISAYSSPFYLPLAPLSSLLPPAPPVPQPPAPPQPAAWLADTAVPVAAAPARKAQKTSTRPARPSNVLYGVTKEAQHQVFTKIAEYEQVPMLRISAMPQRPRQVLILSFGVIEPRTFKKDWANKSVTLRPNGYRVAFIDSFRAWTIELRYVTCKNGAETNEYKVVLRDPTNGSPVCASEWKGTPTAAICDGRNAFDRLFSGQSGFECIGDKRPAGPEGRKRPKPNGEEMLCLKFDALQRQLYLRFRESPPPCSPLHEEWLEQMSLTVVLPNSLGPVIVAPFATDASLADGDNDDVSED